MSGSSTPEVAEPLGLVLVGAHGRMGRAIAACAGREPGRFRLHAEVGREGTGDARNLTGLAAGGGDVFVDFSLPGATTTVLAGVTASRTPLVLGTTGHDPATRAAIASAAEVVPVVFAANFSVGVNALFWLTRRAAEILGPDFDLEVIETHHRLKQDAPSGTARRLVEILADARGMSAERDARHGRVGDVGTRGAGEIGVHAVRGGDVVGEHTVLFAGPAERVELTHRAGNRELFALGALRAARWVAEPGRAPGLYDMEDVLGLRDLQAFAPHFPDV